MEFEELKGVRTLHNVNGCGSCDMGYSIRHLSSIERVFHFN